MARGGGSELPASTLLRRPRVQALTSEVKGPGIFEHGHTGRTVVERRRRGRGRSKEGEGEEEGVGIYIDLP